MILHWHTKFYANRMIADGVMTSYWFYKMATIASQINFWLLIWPHVTFRKIKAIVITNFNQISQSTTEILLLLVSENKRSPSWNSSSCFDFDLFTAIGMWFCTNSLLEGALLIKCMFVFFFLFLFLFSTFHCEIKISDNIYSYQFTSTSVVFQLFANTQTHVHGHR